MFGKKKINKQFNIIFFLISVGILSLSILLLNLFHAYAYFLVTKTVTNNITSGTLLIQTDYTDTNLDTPDTNLYLRIKNIGTLPLQLTTTPTIETIDCGYILMDNQTISNLLFPKTILNPSHEVTYNYGITLSDQPISTNLDCKIKFHIVAWQTNFITPTLGFVQDKNIDIHITKIFVTPSI